MVYEGQPAYVKLGFLADLFEPWCRIEGSEWGEWLSALHDAAKSAISISIQDKAAILLDWILQELIEGMDGDDRFLDDDYPEDVAYAREEYEKTVEYWRQRAKGFNGPDENASKMLEETLESLPAFFKPYHQ